MAHETSADLTELQRLLDQSQASAGAHLRSIFSDERRVGAAELPSRLPGVQVLNLATVTARAEPQVYGGDWSDWGGESPYARIDAEKMFTFGGV